MTLGVNTKTTEYLQPFVKKTLKLNREERGFNEELNYSMCGRKMMKQKNLIVKNLLVIFSRCVKKKREN